MAALTREPPGTDAGAAGVAADDDGDLRGAVAIAHILNTAPTREMWQHRGDERSS